MHTIAGKSGGSFKSKKEQKQALGKSFGICRSKSDLVGKCDDCKKEKSLFYQKLCKECYGKRVKNYVKKYDMDENKLRQAIDKLEAGMKERGITGSEERETYYRVHLMPYFATGMIKTNAQKLAENSIKLQQDILKEHIKQAKIQQDYLQEKLSRLEKVLKNVRPKDREIILEEIEKIKKKIQAKSQYKNYSRSVKYEDAIAGGIRQKLAEKKERSIFFKPFRPLETLHEVTQTAGKTSSSNIVGMEYSQGMLKVTFNWKKLGEVEYGYDVGPDFYERMAKSQSKGKFLWSDLRGKTPGYVIDNPSKKTPGGVGGSIVPYTKITKRKIQGKEFNKLQKFYAKQLGGKVKVVAHMPFVRKKQKILSRESKPFDRSSLEPQKEQIKKETPKVAPAPIKKAPSPLETKKSEVKKVAIPTKKESQVEKLKKKIAKEGIKKIPLPGKKASPKEAETPKESQAEKLKKKIVKEGIKKTPLPGKKKEASPEKSKLLKAIAKKIGSAATKSLGNLGKLATKTLKAIITEKNPKAVIRAVSRYKKQLKKEKKRKKKDFVWVIVAELSDMEDIEVKGHYAMRHGKKVWISGYTDKRKAKEERVSLFKSKGKTELPKTKSQLKEEKIKEKAEAKEKATTQRRAGSEEQKRRREIEKQARGQKAVAPPEPREKAIQKLIEQTGMERSEAENRIAKLMGVSPEQAKKKAETKQREEKFKAKNKELTSKLLVLNELNKKIQSAPLRNILKLFLKGFMLIATGKDAKVVLNKFENYYNQLRKEKKLDQKNKEKLLIHITKVHKELLALSKAPEDFQYISAAVDKCAKQKMAQAGEKGNYQQFVGDCIRIIGIARRSAGLPKRAPGGTSREQRRAGRRERTQTRRQPSAFERRMQRNRERREAHEAEQEELRQRIIREREWQRAGEIMQQQREARRQQREERREAIRREQETQRREQERLNTLVEMKHEIERLLGESNLQDARRVLQWMGTNIGLIRDAEVKLRWQGQLEISERRISRAERESEEERQRLERIREEVRRTRQERNPRIRIMREGEGSATGLQETESGSVMHIEIPSEAQEEITPEQYRSRYMGYGDNPPPSSARLTPPPGTRQTRRGHWRRDGTWVNPSFSTPEQISQATARRRALRSQQGRHAIYTGQQVSSRARETPQEEAERGHRRKKRGPKMRWRTRVSLDGVRKNSLQDITRADLRSGMRIVLNPIAKRDYDFVNPDFNPRKTEREGNRRRIQIRKGESAGIASFSINHHPITGIYLYLGTLRQKPDFRGRGASSILKPAIMWADSQNMVIGGSPHPIGREQEVAPAHLSREEQRSWSHSNSRDLNNFYRRLEGVPNYEYGGSFARFPHLERIGGRSSASAGDLIRMKLDQAKKHLVFFNPKYLEEIGGYLFYFDPNEDQFYQVDT